MIVLSHALYFILVSFLCGLVLGMQLQKYYSNQIIKIQQERIAFLRKLMGWET